MIYVGVSLNGEPPKSFNINHFIVLNQPHFWGTPVLRNPMWFPKRTNWLMTRDMLATGLWLILETTHWWYINTRSEIHIGIQQFVHPVTLISPIRKSPAAISVKGNSSSYSSINSLQKTTSFRLDKWVAPYDGFPGRSTLGRFRG